LQINVEVQLSLLQKKAIITIKFVTKLTVYIG